MALTYVSALVGYFMYNSAISAQIRTTTLTKRVIKIELNFNPSSSTGLLISP